MRFYKFKAQLKEQNAEKAEEKLDREEFAGMMEAGSANSYRKTAKQAQVFAMLSGKSKSLTISGGAVAQNMVALEKAFDCFFDAIGKSVDSISREEITLAEFHHVLTMSDHRGFVDRDTLVERFGLEILTNRRMDDCFSEKVLDSAESLSALKRKTESLFCNESMDPELERIFSSGKAKKQVKGHPVHYMISAENAIVGEKMTDILLSALLKNHRIENRRYATIAYSCDAEVLPGNLLRNLYSSCFDGALILTPKRDRDGQEPLDRHEQEVLGKLTGIAMEYRNDVLTIFRVPMEQVNVQEYLMKRIKGTPIVYLEEGSFCKEQAKRVLRRMARAKGVCADSKLLTFAEHGDAFTVADVKYKFDRWLSEKMQSCYYPLYRDLTANEQEEAKIDQQTALERLRGMTGLTEVKQVIERTVNYFKLEKLRAKSMEEHRPSMHMVFTGNPGTAKTTVARLFGEILFEEGILPNGKFVEVGRKDLVGMYVGHTARCVKKAFEQASGGVLFIDEAYSLVDYHNNSFGDEAINAIVQEMENHRSDTVVIFAGYPKPMEEFLSRNPGLRSRIAAHVPFADYNAEELCLIAEDMAKQKGYHLADGCHEKMYAIFTDVADTPDFGNGRFARNLLEQAGMEQANRLAELSSDTLTDEMMNMLYPEDFSLPAAFKKAEDTRRTIGFSA